jgi:hypothetical protein
MLIPAGRWKPVSAAHHAGGARMSEGEGPWRPQPEGEASLDALAESWLALWRDEIAALAQDPAGLAVWQGLLAQGTAHWAAFVARAGGAAPDAAAPPAAAPGPAAAPPAPCARPAAGAGGADPAPLLARIAQLEQRLAALEAGAGEGAAPAGRPRRRRRDA